MEKVQVTICGRNYNLMTDDSPERIIGIARELEANIKEYTNKLSNKNESEILTLVALNVLDEAQKAVTATDAELAKLREDIISAKEQLLVFENESNEKLHDNMESAGSELEQIASVKDQENEELRKKLHEYELDFERFVEERDNQIKELKAGFASANTEMEHIAMVKETENSKLRTTLNSYEMSFDLYVKLKEDEIEKLRKELDVKSKEADELRQRLAAVSDDGQLTFN